MQNVICCCGDEACRSAVSGGPQPAAIVATSAVPHAQFVVVTSPRDQVLRVANRLADGRFAEAYAILDRLLAESSNLVQAIHLKVRMLAMEGRHEEAMTLLDP